ncbi:MAG: divergent PAP2 family protein [Candidatus Margulisbacteria bacterium]|nr:divergent PAP2 family protein [Candidatus Margulisiibacteriota bacterium]
MHPIIHPYYPLLAAFSSMFAAQVIKHLFFLIKGTLKINAKNILTAGGMPSTHSALVSGLTLSVALSQGLSSTPFAICLVYSCIVLYDATGIRQAVAKQAAIINRLTPTDEKKLSEFIGHTPQEAGAGVCLGLIIAALLYYL